MPELITRSLEEYEELAIALGNDKHRVQALKQKLENNKLSTPLFDSSLFTQNIEGVLEKIYSDESNH
jgi:predicted O-linked N-acetylglucosamine transferase (SPINDLY family)